MELTKVKLSDVARVEISGVDKKSKPGQKSVRLCNFVDVYHNWAITQDMRDSFMEATASDKEIEALSIKKGQVAFTKDSETRDDIGIPTYIADDFDDVVLGYHNALITPDERKLNGKYLNAFMHSSYIQKYFENNASGSGQRYTLSNDTVNSIPILLPTIKEQEKIGNLFSFIDRKIALNKKMNQKLEAMAKRLYDYWFVQYDFPDKNGHPYKTTGGPMTYNPTLKREIPAGWEVGSFGDCIQLVSNRVDPRDVKKDDFYTPIEVIPKRQMSLDECAPIEDATSGLCSYDKKDILLSNRRVYFHKVCIAPFSGLTRDTVIIFRPKTMENLGFVYQVVNSDHFIEYATVNSYGSEQPVLSWPTVQNYKIVKPPQKIMLEYSERVKDIIDHVLNIQLENIKLKNMRDKLLPLLMNGQVVVG